MLQLSCIQLNKNVHRFHRIFHLIIVCVCVCVCVCIMVLGFLIFIMILNAALLSFRRSCSFEPVAGAVCARFVAQICYGHVVGIDDIVSLATPSRGCG